MPRYFLLVFFVLNCLTVSAKKDKIYYNANQKKTVKDSAQSYVVFNKRNDVYKAQQFSLRDELIMEGHFTTIPDDLGQERQGEFINYYYNGMISSKGVYTNGMRTGVWDGYLYPMGKTKRRVHYENDSLNGPCVIYTEGANSGKDEIQVEGQYTNGKKEGVWKSYGKLGVERETTYVTDNITQVKRLGDNGKVLKVLDFSDGKLVSAHAYDNDGKERDYTPDRSDSTSAVVRTVKVLGSYNDGKFVPLPAYDKDGKGHDYTPISGDSPLPEGKIFTYVEQMPNPGFDLAQFLKRNLRYPTIARQDNTQGRVLVKFVIDEQGMVVDPHIVMSVSPELDAEALRVVSLFPKWKPGEQNGKPVKVYFNLPIVFKLR